MKKYLYIAAIASILFTSCSDFLDEYPGDSLSPSTFWKTESDAKLALIGCYNGWENEEILYRDCASDNSYSFHKHEGWQVIGNGSMGPSDTGSGYYDYITINRCNDFLQHIDDIPFKDNNLKERYKAEVRFIRAYRYFLMTLNYGDVPLSLQTYDDIESSRISRTPKAQVEEFVLKEFADVANILPEVYDASEKGHVTKGAALAMSMRFHLYLGQYDKALTNANAIENLGIYELFPTYEGLFLEANTGSSECILDVQYVENDYGNWLIAAMMPNGDGGWSSIVPLKSLVDAYETADGLTIQEAQAQGTYDPAYPFVNRDPRLKHTVLYPGQGWNGRIFDPFPRNIIREGKEVSNPDYYNGANNASKTAFSYKKYIAPADQYDDPWNTAMNIMVCRYAEVLLTIAEAKVELNKIDNDVYDNIDAVRERAGMPKVDRTKYNNQSALRELIRRERRAEFAMEGLRRADIIRWNIAKDVLNGAAQGCTVGVINVLEPDEDKRAHLTGDPIPVESRSFQLFNKYLPMDQEQLDRNPNLTQTEGY